VSITLAKRLVRDVLREGIPEVLARLDERFADGIVTPNEVTYYTEEHATLDQFPACELLGRASDPQGSNEAQEYVHSLSVVWTLVGDDEATLVAQVERVILATRQLTYRTLLDPSLHGAPMVPGRESYSMLARTRGLSSPLVKAGAIDVSVRTLDDGF
jgi:hypothetical protein